MRILVVNDDGITEKGLKVLTNVLKLDHDVWVLAPHKNRSGVSNAITMNKPLCVHKIDEQVFTCSGLPVDCTIEGCKGVFGFVPDVVVSGINRGANIGTDILYSGTAAGARQASLYGVPSIAVSLESKINKWNFKPLADFVLDNLNMLISLCEKDIFININALDLHENESYKGVKMSVPAIRDYKDSLEFYVAPNGDTYSFFKGGTINTDIENTDSISETDFSVVEQGFIAVSKVYALPKAVDGVKVPDFRLRR